MFKCLRFQTIACVVIGSGLGYLAASGALKVPGKAHADVAVQESVAKTSVIRADVNTARTCCQIGAMEPLLLAQADVQVAQANSQNRAAPARGKKPNILFIMGDDIGWMQPSCYHRGLMVGETPNIDRIATEGGMFMHYYAESSCTAGRCAFITGMHPYRAGMVLPQLPGAISYLRPGTPCLAQFLLNLGYSTGEFGKNHLGDHPDSLPTAHGFQEFWGYLYHLDAMQQVSFPDINSSPTSRPSCRR